VLWASCVSFSRFVHNVLHGDSVLYDNHFGFTDIPWWLLDPKVPGVHVSCN